LSSSFSSSSSWSAAPPLAQGKARSSGSAQAWSLSTSRLCVRRQSRRSKA
jgi:hypothetical protein